MTAFDYSYHNAFSFCFLTEICQSRWELKIVSFNLHKKTSNWKQPIFGDATTGFPAKWRLRNEHRNSILMTRHYPDLGSASDWPCRVGNLIQPIRSNTTIWVVRVISMIGWIKFPTRHDQSEALIIQRSCRATLRLLQRCVVWLDPTAQ